MDRMTALQQTTTGATYRYRADGMRCQKVEGITINANLDNNNEVSGYDDVWASNKPTWRFFYDGQTPVADDHTYAVGNVIHIDRTAYVPGPRGIDCVDNWTGLPYVLQSTQYPFYDCHGNNPSASLRAGCGSVSRSGSGSYSLGGERVYDAWGLAHGSADSQQRYCANLGHRQDDETGTYTGGSPDGDGLVYMRARYYEPGTGRFISEDPTASGLNWFVYCHDDPVSLVDATGKDTLSDSILAALGIAAALWTSYHLIEVMGESPMAYMAGVGYVLLAVAWICDGTEINGGNMMKGLGAGSLLAVSLTLLYGLPMAAVEMETTCEANSIAGHCVSAIKAHVLGILLFLEVSEAEEATENGTR